MIKKQPDLRLTTTSQHVQNISEKEQICAQTMGITAHAGGAAQTTQIKKRGRKYICTIIETVSSVPCNQGWIQEQKHSKCHSSETQNKSKVGCSLHKVLKGFAHTWNSLDPEVNQQQLQKEHEELSKTLHFILSTYFSSVL